MKKTNPDPEYSFQPKSDQFSMLGTVEMEEWAGSLCPPSVPVQDRASVPTPPHPHHSIPSSAVPPSPHSCDVSLHARLAPLP